MMEDDEIEKRGNEMAEVLKLMKNLDFFKSQVLVLANPEEVAENPEFLSWFKNQETKSQFFEWIFTNNHEVGDKNGQWANGFLGSRWCDKKFNNRWCRIAFYDQNELVGLKEGENKYKLMICTL